MSFSITILGSGSAVPTALRNPTSQYVECNGRNFLIDCGEGTQMQIRRLGIKFQRIDHVLISHLHGDHYFGLVGLLSTMHLMGRKKAVFVYAPEGLKEIVLLQLNAAGSRLAFDVFITEFPPETNGVVFEDEKVVVRYFPLSHKIPTQGFRIDQKRRERSLLGEKAKADGIKIEYFHRLKNSENIVLEDGTEINFEEYTHAAPNPLSYAYCSDTKYYEAIVPFIEAVDVLYHEATFTEDMIDRAHETKHSTAKEAANIAKQAKVGRLIMGHLSARYDDGSQHEVEARAIFEPSDFVNDGDVIVLES